MKLLIDGDLIVHRSTVAVERDLRFDDRFHVLMSDFTDARCLMEDTLHELREQAETDDVVFAFSDPEWNFRKELAGGDYKANRANTRKPLAYWSLREFVEQQYETITLPGIEADDVMGLLTTKYPTEYIIWTLDKDLKQIPGYHLIDDEVEEITKAEGDYFFYFQILAGDPTDGYYGCPKIGAVKAARLLDAASDGPQEIWQAIIETYEKNGATSDDALFNARMARILRHGEYKKGSPVLWTPPQT